MSTTLDPNATIVMSGLPMTNNSGISFILHVRRPLISDVPNLRKKQIFFSLINKINPHTLSVIFLILPWSLLCYSNILQNEME